MNIFANIELLIYSTLLFTPPLLFSAIGALFTDASGITNIALDGFMTIGAFVGCASTYFLQNTTLGLLMAGLVSSIFAILFAILVLKLHIDEILVGFTLNMFMPATILIFSYFLFNSMDTPPLSSDLKIPILFRNLATSDNAIINFISNIFSTYSTTYLAFILVPITTFILYKTSTGLYIRACGSNKIAAVYVGINKIKIQFLCILISGFLCGISGAIFTMAVTNQFRIASISGQGYIALAAVLFGGAKPYRIMLCCIIFGLFSGLKTIIPASSSMTHLIQTIPYLATIIILILHYQKKRHLDKLH